MWNSSRGINFMHINFVGGLDDADNDSCAYFIPRTAKWKKKTLQVLLGEVEGCKKIPALKLFTFTYTSYRAQHKTGKKEMLTNFYTFNTTP